jgi:hypothetical protein
MRTKIAAATLVLIGAGATTVAALDPPINMRGSDTLFLMSKDVITNCSGGLGIAYQGTGSGNGESGMLNTCKGVGAVPDLQTTAPMSRFMNGAAATGACGCNSGTTAAGLAVALDGVAVVANGVNAPTSCGGVASTGKTITLSAGGTYTAADAFDFLRVAFYGIHHDGTGTCGDDVRKSLLANYANFFSAACPSGTAGCPTGVRHLWRRDDPSGTTDTFNTLIGGGAATGKFCNVNGGLTVTNGQVLGGTAKNGFDFQDNDPIRVACSGNGLTAGEQLCGDAAQGHLGTLGMLLTVFVPETSDVPATETFPVGVCTPGVVASLPATKSTYTGVCPAGNPSFGGKCFSSMFRNADGSLNANCIQVIGTGRCPTLTPAGVDCRGANLWLRHPDGSLAIDTSIAASKTAPPVPPAGRFYLGAFYKMHVTTKQANGTGLCTRPSSTEQIGCLSSIADPCTMGYAGRSASDVAPAVALDVGGVPDSNAAIQNLVLNGPFNNPPGSNLTTYPLARKLYFNSMIGFSHVTGQELAMAKCYSDDAFMDSAAGTPPHIIANNGFVQLPLVGGRRALCEDFDEVAHGCTGAGATNTNSCATNPAGIPPN